MVEPLQFAGCFSSAPEAERICRFVFAGLPDDSQSSFLRGCAAAPRAIRESYDGRCFNSVSESGVDLKEMVFDLGDLSSEAPWDTTRRRYCETAAALFRRGRVPFFAGGDHAVTVPIGEALAALGEPVHVIQFDAHPDLYPEYEGNSHSHACTGFRLLEQKHVASLTQIGIRALNSVQAQQANRFKDRLRLFPARDVEDIHNCCRHLPAGALVYLTIDLDCFDPAFAPGVSHPVPGGLTARQVLNFLQESDFRLAGADVVELNPNRDFNNQTAILAGRVLHEAMAMAILQQEG